MAKETTGAIVNEKAPTQEDIVQEWKRKISKGEYPFIYVNQPLTQSDKRYTGQATSNKAP